VTAGYHRYFAHRSFHTSRLFQFVLAFGAQTSAQKGALWWAAHHRRHHRYADTERDLHSPQRGFWWSHVGWILCDRYGPTDFDAIPDFARYPELRYLNRHDWIPPWALGAACFVIGGWSGLIIGFFCSTVLLWHTTFSINSLAHVIGRRRYDTNDTSGNSFALAAMTGGEGWHNNHHRFPTAARQGFRWWEIDTTYYILRALSWARIVRDLRQPPASVRAVAFPEPR
jgi:stearoyl-CoA desaturase (delta-9 desaturase)